ncbi:MAG TPA: substrate-binding domain-containing protein [Ottowia sp.]|uniref:substrate-binding domain-containing protein n=1 Tax=Ottowia sp. TaxID=1898956 RepID=UPI002D1175DE|nr:substrate-binding domain-containing protein [Ottowia sp.]HMN21034.1 substrate-binding domain-containing protein [Ottowia sp.]
MNTPAPLHLISSMATQRLLAELIAAPERTPGGADVRLEAVGGVDAARRVAAGEAFDLVVLGAGALDKLIAGGHVLVGSRVDLVRSATAVAVPAGAPHPDIGSAEAVRAAVLAAPSVGYSTGPSGVALAALFARWGIADAVQAKLVTPPPGTPVGQLVARGEVALGFQQLSELMHLPGIDVLGVLPPAIEITTVFSGGVAASSRRPEAARALLADLAAPWTAALKRANGMNPA